MVFQMIQITKSEQLNKGDEIIHILLDKFVILRFVCTNVFGEKHSHFLQENGEMTTLNNSVFQNEEWFLVEDTPQFWLEAWEKRKRILLSNIQTVEEVISNLKEQIV